MEESKARRRMEVLQMGKNKDVREERVRGEDTART